MNYDQLQDLISKNLSTHQIAKTMNCSQTNVRHWMKKYNLKTQNLSREEFKDKSNGFKCLFCSKELIGKKTLYCSSVCKSRHSQTNTYEKQKERSCSRKISLIELSGGKCVKCGYCKNYAALQFHHKNPINKLFNLDARKLSNGKWEDILNEFYKCELLCANCHAETHNPDKNL
jgi:predicted transcriptional regulator